MVKDLGKAKTAYRQQADKLNQLSADLMKLQYGKKKGGKSEIDGLRERINLTQADLARAYKKYQDKAAELQPKIDRLAKQDADMGKEIDRVFLQLDACNRKCDAELEAAPRIIIRGNQEQAATPQNIPLNNDGSSSVPQNGRFYEYKTPYMDGLKNKFEMQFKLDGMGLDLDMGTGYGIPDYKPVPQPGKNKFELGAGYDYMDRTILKGYYGDLNGYNDYMQGFDEKDALDAIDGTSTGFRSGPYFFGQMPVPKLQYQGSGPNDPYFFQAPEKKGFFESGVFDGGEGLGDALQVLPGSDIDLSKADGDPAIDQWGLHKVGFLAYADTGSAWNIEDGSKKNIVVAVIDSGLDMNHEDRPEYIWVNDDEIPGNGIDDDGNGYIDDIHGWNFVNENNELDDNYGHGTFVAGIIAARRNNGLGIAGINPGAQIMVLKTGDREMLSNSLGLYRAIRYAVDNGAKVINVSLGGQGSSRLLQIALNYARAKDRLVVVAAGNGAGNVGDYIPGGMRNVVSVAALDMTGDWRRWSNKGANIALTAPGDNIFSLSATNGLRDDKMLPYGKSTYHQLTGTSFAAPIVSATASLMWAKKPELTVREVEDILLATTTELNEPGWDFRTGNGLLNARSALSMADKSPLVVRPIRVLQVMDGDDLDSLELYGTVRGRLDKYIVEVGQGSEPRSWEKICEFETAVENGLLCIIGEDDLSGNNLWSIRIRAMDTNRQEKQAVLSINIK